MNVFLKVLLIIMMLIFIIFIALLVMKLVGFDFVNQTGKKNSTIETIIIEEKFQKEESVDSKDGSSKDISKLVDGLMKISEDNVSKKEATEAVKDIANSSYNLIKNFSH